MVSNSERTAPYGDRSSEAPFPVVDAVEHILAVKRDAAARNVFWKLQPGKSTTYLKPSSYHSPTPPKSNTPAKPPGMSTKRYMVPNFSVWPPQSSTLRPTLDPRLQRYFHRMDQMVPRTCHPLFINQEARIITHTLSLPANKSQTQVIVVRTLILAGLSDIEYSRSIALLIHDVLKELLWINWGIMYEVQQAVEKLVIDAVKLCWTNLDTDHRFLPATTGLAPIFDSLYPLRRRMLCASVHFGDLVSIGLIHMDTFLSVIDEFVQNLSSATQCRALYLLILRGTFPVVSPQNATSLLKWRDKIYDLAKYSWIRDDDMAIRWIIEISNIVERVSGRRGKSWLLWSPGAHIWDPKLTAHALHELLVPQEHSESDKLSDLLGI